MTRQAEAGRSKAELFQDTAIIHAGGECAAVRALLVQLAEAEASVSLGYRRGTQPPRPVREL